MFAIIFISLFFLVIIILIVVAVYGSKKDKQKQRIELLKRKKDNKISTENEIKILLMIYYLIELVDHDVKNFKPSIGIKTIGDINRNASEIVKDLDSSQILKDTYLIKEREEEIKPIIEELKKTKATKWESEAFFTVNFIRNKSELLLKSEQNQKIFEDIKSEIKYAK